MTSKQLPARAALWAAALLALAVSFGPSPVAIAQQLGEGMDRTGTVGIQNDAEKHLFFSLLCTCGCPRETLGTCTCGFAHQRRDELRAELAAGRTDAQIVADYVQRFGTQALAVPPATGGQQALYLLPLGAIVAMAGFVVFTLRRWRKRSDEAPTPQAAAPGAPPDAYDDKLDDELRALDDE